VYRVYFEVSSIGTEEEIKDVQLPSRCNTYVIGISCGIMVASLREGIVEIPHSL